jgi:hypothetical protein
MSLTGEEIAPSKFKELANKLLGTCREVRREVGMLLLVSWNKAFGAGIGNACQKEYRKALLYLLTF